LAAAAATNAAPKTMGRKSRWTSSSTNTRPDSGALKAAARPAPAPAAVSVRRSRGGLPIRRATSSPTAPPICTVGPSRPSTNPPPMASTPPTSFTASRRIARIGRSRSSTALRLGMPLPAASGANRRTSQTASAAVAAIVATGASRSSPSCAWLHTSSASSALPAPVSSIRNTDASSPESAPTSAARGYIRRRCRATSR